MRKSSGFREPPIPPLGKGRLSPSPAARMRNMMYGNGKGMDMGPNWEEEDDQRFVIHMRGLPFRATEQDIFKVSNTCLFVLNFPPNYCTQIQ